MNLKVPSISLIRKQKKTCVTMSFLSYGKCKPKTISFVCSIEISTSYKTPSHVPPKLPPAVCETFETVELVLQM